MERAGAGRRTRTALNLGGTCSESYSRRSGPTEEEEEEMRNRKHALAVSLLACIGVAVLALGATTGSAKTKKKTAAFKVAWIYVGPHNDAGWSQAHDQGRLYVQKALGSKVQTTYKEKVAVGPQLQQTVASLVREGYSMIFGTSYGYFDKKLAAKYPQV